MIRAVVPERTQGSRACRDGQRSHPLAGPQQYNGPASTALVGRARTFESTSGNRGPVVNAAHGSKFQYG